MIENAKADKWVYEFNQRSQLFTPANDANNGKWITTYNIPPHAFECDDALLIDHCQKRLRQEAAIKLAEQICDGGMYTVSLQEEARHELFGGVSLMAMWKVNSARTMDIVFPRYLTDCQPMPNENRATGLIRRSNSVPVVVCLYCRSTNSALASSCCKCGAPLGDALILGGIIRI